MNIEACIQYFL